MELSPVPLCLAAPRVPDKQRGVVLAKAGAPPRDGRLLAAKPARHNALRQPVHVLQVPQRVVLATPLPT